MNRKFSLSKKYVTDLMAVMGIHDDEACITSSLDEAALLTCERNIFSSDHVSIYDSGHDTRGNHEPATGSNHSGSCCFHQ